MEIKDIFDNEDTCWWSLEDVEDIGWFSPEEIKKCEEEFVTWEITKGLLYEPIPDGCVIKPKYLKMYNSNKLCKNLFMRRLFPEFYESGDNKAN